MADEQWHLIGLTTEGQTLAVGGVSVWDPAWRSLHRSVPLRHPQYPSQVHPASLYEWPDADGPLLLAVAEVSAGVYVLGVSPPTVEIVRG